MKDSPRNRDPRKKAPLRSLPKKSPLRRLHSFGPPLRNEPDPFSQDDIVPGTPPTEGQVLPPEKREGDQLTEAKGKQLGELGESAEANPDEEHPPTEGAASSLPSSFSSTAATTISGSSKKKMTDFFPSSSRSSGSNQTMPFPLTQISPSKRSRALTNTPPSPDSSPISSDATPNFRSGAKRNCSPIKKKGAQKKLEFSDSL